MSFRSLQGPGRNNDPEPFSDLRERLRSLKQQVDDVSGSILRSAGLKAEPDLLRILGTLVVQGDLDVAGDAEVSGLLRSENYVPGASGWCLTSTGLEVNDITLRGGIIGNDALANPVLAQSNFADQSNLALTTTATPRAPVSITIPPGFTQAAITVLSTLYAHNSNAAAQYILVQARAEAPGVTPGWGPGGTELYPAGAWGTVHSSVVRSFIGLTPGTNLVGTSAVRAGVALAAEANVEANTHMLAIFTR